MPADAGRGAFSPPPPPSSSSRPVTWNREPSAFIFSVENASVRIRTDVNVGIDLRSLLRRH